MEGSGFVRAIERWPAGEVAGSAAIDFGVAVGRARVRTTEPVGVVDLTARVEAFPDGAAGTVPTTSGAEGADLAVMAMYAPA